MAVFKSAVMVQARDGAEIGEGMAYVHLPHGLDRAQDAVGTVSLRRWEPGQEAPILLRLADGRRLSIAVSRDVLSECSRKHILRFGATWPPDGDDGRPGGEGAERASVDAEPS